MMCLAKALPSTQKGSPRTRVLSCRSKKKSVHSQHKNFSVEKEKFGDEDSTSLTKESSYGKLLCFQSLPCSGELQGKYGTPSTKVLGGGDDMASSKPRHPSAAFSDLRPFKNVSEFNMLG